MAGCRRLISTSAVLALLAAATAAAQDVAFTVFEGWESQASLQRLDLTNGALTAVGAVGGPCTRIAFDADGSLYGVDPVNARLLRLDVSTGSGATVGSLGLTIVEATGLTFDADGHLWMAAFEEDLGPSLFEVDRDTGAATWIGAIDDAYIGALAAGGGTVLTASYALAALDTTSSAVTPVAGSSFGIWLARALDFDDHGNLRGLMLCGPCAAPFDVLITVIIDTDSGVISGFGPYEPSGTEGLAILPGGIFLDGFETADLAAWSSTPTRFAATAETQ